MKSHFFAKGTFPCRAPQFADLKNSRLTHRSDGTISVIVTLTWTAMETALTWEACPGTGAEQPVVAG